ncbi:MAG: aldehyde dehydrogenase family protein [Candidatus Niyogibacteria bacterium CG10_big_fil_rev_8_21_14_0_10_46_36]|uniref:aldehyde dehydrogenase (NAD(+)) n=1 Tax=Candidatus Niyogibacteria bacterium CG10_big_fil_rev_8_21_14_0_10_46_36 TaxID=1974726 RepID=A0A2H0TE04_9BACT|nr:MAG: aldehyde dehydrogenase family protein [Candidatus Niyogibacteria bacterium CG10_big_fil_rev_8_21_14_0_10_46_36]
MGKTEKHIQKGTYAFLERLGIKNINPGAWAGSAREHTDGALLDSINPSTGEMIAQVTMAGSSDYNAVIEKAKDAFLTWRMVPAPKRGLIVREIVRSIIRHKKDLGSLIALEMGKIRREGEGEVQEIIDLEKVASGISRGKNGHSFYSERARHALGEWYNPLGVIGVITAFNFPVAVWGWNALIALVTGNVVVWKPSLETPLCAIAIQRICNRVLKKYGHEGVLALVIGDNIIIGERMIADKNIDLISFTGSTRVGRRVGEIVGARLGRSLLELGGNNPMIVLDDADIDLAAQAAFFGFIGTTAQRCTTTRRIYVHKDRYSLFIGMFLDLCGGAHFGNPLNKKTLAGPLINKSAVKKFLEATAIAEKQGGEILIRGERMHERGCFVAPTVVRMPKGKNLPIALEETFGPILYITEIDSLEEGISLANEAPQQLAAALFTEKISAMYHFRGPEGSRAGILNINCGTSGAESTTPFGGNYDTGWGREAGGDAWRNYVRESGGATNYSGVMELAQGIRFTEKKK